MKLDQFIARECALSQREARLRILEGIVNIDGSVSFRHEAPVTKFSSVTFDGKTLRKGIEQHYVMFHKPVGVLSATKDRTHRTVLDFLSLPDKETLHLAGRLDRSSSGLLLLTNDGHWSEALTQPDRKVEKHYLVETDRPIPTEAVLAFREGFDFEPEGIHTKPAELTLLGPRHASVTLHEGRYHQIKRMFHRLDGIRLVRLHRDRIGSLTLPADLKPGQYRHLTDLERESLAPT